MNELQKTTYNGVWNYNGQTITEHGTGFTVYHEGEELYFENLDQAKTFINNLEVSKMKEYTKKGYVIKVNKDDEGKFYGEIYKNGFKIDYLLYSYERFDTEEDVKEKAFRIIDCKIYTNEELEAPLKDYSDYHARVEYLINHYLDGVPHKFASYFNEEQKKEIDDYCEKYNLQYNDPVSMHLVQTEEIVRDHYKKWTDLQNMFEEKRKDFEFLKDTFIHELWNHEYIYNGYQGNYDVLSAVYGNLTYNDDDDVNKYFEEAKMSETEKKAYVCAVNEYMEKASACC